MDGILMVLLKPLGAQKPFLLLGYIHLKPLKLGPQTTVDTVHTKGLPIDSENAVDGWHFEISGFRERRNMNLPLTWIHTIKIKTLAAFIS
jgi:hypothetical protein